MKFTILWYIGKLKDWGCSRDGQKTKKKTIQQFVDLYGGNEQFYIEIAYATLLRMIFITMMFGVGIPILFPLTFIALFVTYVCEKYWFAYIYKKPPMYNNLISEDSLRWLKWGFPLQLLFGFWILSSRNLFGNWKADPNWVGGFNGNHNLLNIFIPNVGWPLLFGVFWFVYYYYFYMRF